MTCGCTSYWLCRGGARVVGCVYDGDHSSVDTPVTRTIVSSFMSSVEDRLQLIAQVGGGAGSRKLAGSSMQAYSSRVANDSAAAPAGPAWLRRRASRSAARSGQPLQP